MATQAAALLDKFQDRVAPLPLITPVICDNFLYDFKGALPRAGDRQAGRSGLDKGTLAAAFIGLKRAGQRQPDRRTAYRPPPLIKPAARLAREVPLIRARRSSRQVLGGPSRGNRCAPGRRLPPLGPPGHGGVGARVFPAGRRTGSASQRSAPGARAAKRAILPTLQCQAGQDHAQERFASYVLAYRQSYSEGHQSAWPALRETSVL